MPKRQIIDTLQPRGKQYNREQPCASAENMRNPRIHVTLDVHTVQLQKKYWVINFYAQTSEATPQYHKKGKGAKQHNSSTRKNVPCPSWKQILFPSPVVLEKGRCPNTVAKASLLPLVQARAKDGKYPLHESRRRLNQRYGMSFVHCTRKSSSLSSTPTSASASELPHGSKLDITYYRGVVVLCGMYCCAAGW